RLVLGTCMATVGIVSNGDHMNVVLGKAGRKRWLGRRPRVRGVAMNPVDHPMGGGEGRSSGGHPRSRTGLLAKGKRTRSPKKYSISVEELNNYSTCIKKRAVYRTPLGKEGGCYERIRKEVSHQDLVEKINDLSGLCRSYLCCA